MARSNMKAKVVDRVNDDPTADAIVAAALRGTAKRKADAQLAKQKAKRASGAKKVHGVDNDSAVANSSRQVDVDSIDRDNDLPTQWKRPSSLDAPPPRAGYEQRWVRYRAGNMEDSENIEKAMDQGWRPVERATARKGHLLTAKSSDQYGKYYVKRGLMLMELPRKIALQRKAFYDKKLRTMTDSVERDLLRDTNKIMPVLAPEKRSSVTRTARRGNLDASIPDDNEE